MASGYHGCVLRIDASSGHAERVPVSDDVLRAYLGGSGLGTRLLLDAGAAEADPLSPEASLVFAFSPLVGSPLTTSAKFAVVSKSPLTGRINDSLASSGFAVAGKGIGCDAILITGQAPEFSVIVIDAEGTEDGALPAVRLEPAGDVRGATCRDTEERLRARLGPAFRIASIGPAGERLVRYATISHDGRHAGRGGSGAVLGAKRIKAIAVRGKRRAQWARPERTDGAEPRSVEAIVRSGHRQVPRARHGHEHAGLQPVRIAADAQLPAGDVRRGGQPVARDAERHPGQDARELCGLHHRLRAHLRVGTEGAKVGVRVEYESLFALGSLCGVGDAEAVLRASKRCDELGIDTISTGGTIAFAMECVEQGWLDAPWLTFGSGEALLRAIELIGAREGLGDLLAEGSRRAAAVIGHDSIAIAPQVKGLEIPGYEPRALQTMALGFAVGARGADHNRSGAYEVDFSDKVDRRHVTLDAVRHAIDTEDKAAMMDSMILCKFLRGVFEDFYGESAVMLRRGDRLGRDRRRAARDGAAHRGRQARVQPARGVDARRGHAARPLPQYAAAERPRGGAEPRAP